MFFSEFLFSTDVPYKLMFFSRIFEFLEFVALSLSKCWKSYFAQIWKSMLILHRPSLQIENVLSNLQFCLKSLHWHLAKASKKQRYEFSDMIMCFTYTFLTNLRFFYPIFTLSWNCCADIFEALPKSRFSGFFEIMMYFAYAFLTFLISGFAWNFHNEILQIMQTTFCVLLKQFVDFA